MGLTNFPNGISSFGVPVLPGMGGLTAMRKVYFVDGANGTDDNNGLSVGQPYLTVQKALNKVQDDDAILVLRSSYDEALTTGLYATTNVEGRGRYVTLMGVTATPLPYDSPQLFGASGTVATLAIQSPGWRISGFRILGDSGTPIGVSIAMAGPSPSAGDIWGPGATVDHCVFRGQPGSHDGLVVKAATDCRVYATRFENFRSAGFAAVKDGSGGFTFPQLHLIGCWFENNKDNIDFAGQRMQILGNVIGANHENAMAKGIDLRNGGGSNEIHGNYLQGIYQTFAGAGHYEGTGNDDWSGNYSADLDSGSVAAATGITWKAPASS